MATKPLKILSLPVDRGGCGWYRVRQPFEAINEYTDSDCHVIDKTSDDPVEILKALCLADILVVRQGAEMGVSMLKDAANEYAKEAQVEPFHAKVVLDIDDNIELISPYSEHYKEYGTKEYYDKGTKQWVWKDGKGDFDLIYNRKRILDLMLGLRKADMISVTTKKLAEYARQYNKNVAVLPNAINSHAWWQPPFAENKQLRVGWSGGISHYEDWYTLKDPLNKLLRKYKFKLVMVGSAFTGLIDKDLRHLIEVWPWVPFEAHSYRMMLMNLDAAIIPLADLPFNHYKSAIKLCEFSAMGVPSVVANVEPYKKSGINAALYYDTPEQFYTNLEQLLLKPENRKRLGLAAKSEVEEKYTAKQHAQTYLDAYRDILK